MYYKLKIKVSSDSGVGPYEETKTIVNCINRGEDFLVQRGDGYVNVKQAFHTSSADCEVKILSIKPQKVRYYT